MERTDSGESTDDRDRPDPGGSATGTTEGERIDPEEAFSLVGDDTRVAILGALAGEAAPGPSGGGLTFSELRDRVGADNTGQFTTTSTGSGATSSPRTGIGTSSPRRGWRSPARSGRAPTLTGSPAASRRSSTVSSATPTP